MILKDYTKDNDYVYKPVLFRGRGISRLNLSGENFEYPVTCVEIFEQVCHGDIKAENVMVTGWNWLLLVDFASFKPTYLPEVRYSLYSDQVH